MFDFLRNLFRRPGATSTVSPDAVAAELAAKNARQTSRKRSAHTQAVAQQVLTGTAPDDLQVPFLNLSGEKKSFRLPPRLRCFDLDLSDTAIEELPAGITVAHRVNLRGCAQLKRLPDGLRTGTLDLTDCTALTALPQDFAVHFLVLDGCRALHTWSASGQVRLGSVSARNCTSLQELPPKLGPITSLDLGGCTGIQSIPEGVEVTSWVDLKGTGVRELPAALRDVIKR